MTPRRDRRSRVDGEEVAMNGWLLWGIVLPVLLVVAGIVSVRRRKGRR
jgi:LPXTG-motif cell wall-anchored protein